MTGLPRWISARPLARPGGSVSAAGGPSPAIADWSGSPMFGPISGATGAGVRRRPFPIAGFGAIAGAGDAAGVRRRCYGQDEFESELLWLGRLSVRGRRYRRRRASGRQWRSRAPGHLVTRVSSEPMIANLTVVARARPIAELFPYPALRVAAPSCPMPGVTHSRHSATLE